MLVLWADESVNQFVAELRRLARHCEFKTFLEKALRDRFVCGLHSKAIQNRLLTKKDLTLATAVDVAVGMEAAAKEVTELQAGSQAALQEPASAGTTPAGKGNVLKVTTSDYQSCYRCGRSDHKPAQCPIKGLRCHNCGKVRHLQRVCRLAKKPFHKQPAAGGHDP